jgi:peptidoglycan/xylan/chitin deacetylase (PgdA/CDA1 family)
MTQTIPILMYHSIDSQSTAGFRRWTMPPTVFAQHMDWLAEVRYRPITVSTMASALAASQPLPPRCIVITFDDGLHDFITGAMPILQRHGFPATLYVVTGYIGRVSRWLRTVGEGGRPMLSWSDLRTISECGIECGAHTHSHPQLDIMPRDRALAEIQRSKLCLEDCLGREVKTFAYPYGYASRTTRRLVQQAGFTSACRVRHALSSTAEDRFALSRIMVTHDIGVHDLRSLLFGRRLPIAPPPDRLVATGWRLARWALQVNERVH